MAKSEQQRGLYQSEYEHDACGVGMVVNIHGGKSHQLVDDALKVLENMRHRGAEIGKDGDGAGIMLQIPHEFILLQGIPVPEKGQYGTGLVFLPKDEAAQQQILSVMIEEIEREGLQLSHLRTVPTNPACLGERALSTEPDIKQVFITGATSHGHLTPGPSPKARGEAGPSMRGEAGLQRTLYIIRKRIERRVEQMKRETAPSPSKGGGKQSQTPQAGGNERRGLEDFYICSLSNTSIVYKGMLSSMQVREYFLDLSDPYFTSGLALVHSRFSTNTFPTWSLAQPFRLLAHNGEINTIRGNRGWMKARESVLLETSSSHLTPDPSPKAWGEACPSQGGGRPLGADIAPIVQEGMSDSASLDNVLEFFVMSGMSLPHAMAILVPESFNDKNPISEDLKAFYEYHSILMEPWDGPAALLFSDGRFAGGMLDRNGLRPARYTITKNDMMVVASEVGVMDFDPTEVAEKGRLQPGKILLIDTQEGKIYYDGEIKQQLASEHPYRQWLSTNRIQLEKLKSGRHVENGVKDLLNKERLFGYGEEDISSTIVPMAVGGQEPTAAMGNDTPLAVLSTRPQVFFNYFRQQFAQVTNPAIDSIRENLVMSLTEYIGRVGHGILNPDETNCKMVRLPHPVLNNTQLDILCNIRYKGFNTIKLPIAFTSPSPSQGGECLRTALDKLCKDAEKAVDDGYNYIILTDREEEVRKAYPSFGGAGSGIIPSLLAVSAVHHYLIGVGKRVQTALIVESGEIRETMHAALLLGYGASALCPYMVFAILDDLVKRGKIQEDYATAEANYIKAVKKGLFKIMAKMGISTIRSYRGAKIFESIGLSEGLLQSYFGTSVSTIGGIGLDKIAADAIARMGETSPNPSQGGEKSDGGVLKNHGQFHWRKDGIRHAWNPETIATLQLACRKGDYKKFKEFSKLVDQKEEPLFIRDLLGINLSPVPSPKARGEETSPSPSQGGESDGTRAISIDDVEPVSEIVKHFVTGAMSFGALSKEAHETLCLAMNKLGARSNTGEGGEDAARFHSDVDGVSLSSKTKQIASGRFGVTTEYLVNAEELQIKVAQGAKPGEGGQLPGFKVNEIIASTRHSIPGISLISPPPHHDIYSIEDLAQLIFDLKNVNPTAAISVKLVAESGVGTIAAGVAKAKADLIVISGAEGGTGASPASSMRFAGISPEIGLSETQQTLVKNGLRGQVRLQVDGQLKTGRDIILMALLGADEFAFGTTALIVLGCVMMRKCNQNTCPMGVATQNEELRKHFMGKVDHLVNYFTFLAEEVREYLAQMGYRSLNDIIGHTELITTPRADENDHEFHEFHGLTNGNHNSQSSILNSQLGFDFSRLLCKEDGVLRHEADAERDFSGILDIQMLKAAQPAIENGTEVNLDYTIKNTDRAAGTMLSGAIAKRYGGEGLPDDTIQVKFKGSAGQSFGAFLMHGVSFKLEGESNDYFAKGLSGGRIAILPPVRSDFSAEDNIIAGNTGLYGATSGELYVNGKVGERFGVRNSGAIAVIEGAGDHCCEYMTGGRVVVLGETGRNFAAGMSGGVAYVWDKNHNFDYYCNMDMVEINLVEETQYRKELHELIRQHYLYTGSKLARTMLDDWQRYVEEFIQVVPIEYKRVLHEEQMKKLQQKIADVQRDY
ncbi:MAG: glutamate synthase subunit alpha [Prevotella sp.]|nr:glutamate synthase subunit alpha [Prevotella sp.]